MRRIGIVGAGVVEGELPVPSGRAEARARRMMSPAAALAAVATGRALEACGWDAAERLDAGFFLGVGASGGSLEELRAMVAGSLDDEGAFSAARFGANGLGQANPLLAFALMNNFTLCHAAILHGIGGENGACFSRGVGTAQALDEAICLLREGALERALVGGADAATHPVTLAELHREGWLERGLVPADGAAVLALEVEPRAALAELIGVDTFANDDIDTSGQLAAAPALAWAAAALACAEPVRVVTRGPELAAVTVELRPW